MSQLKEFKNIYSGKQGFVCGSGTSLLDVPKDIVNKGIVICVNSAGLHFDKYQYLFVTDYCAIHMKYWEEVVDKAENVILASLSLEEYIKTLPNKNVYILDRKYEYPEGYDYTFSDDLLCRGNDAIVPATHFAYVMRLNPIILCGVDLCYDKHRRYFSDKSYEIKDTNPYRKFFKDNSPHQIEYQNLLNSSIVSINGYESDGYLTDSIPNWNSVYLQNPNIDSIIFNASEISQVPHFKKIKL